MTTPSADPARSYAVLVGIEAYQGGWSLNGPMRDVLDMYDWLRSRGLPATQIQALVSAAAANVPALQQSSLNAVSATSQNIRAALNALHDVQGDLLVIFWTGHGFIADKRHRLLTADATDDDKRNFDLDALRDSLASSYFAGLRRQIVIVDTCATFERFPFTPPSESLPEGDPLASEQFAFFAAQPGQVAKNLGDEQAGLFSRELLQRIRLAPAATWPPDMRLVAEAVQAEFAARRASGLLEQTPIYQWSRDWDGNVIEMAAPPPLAGASQLESWALSFNQLAGLTDALRICKAMSTKDRRDDVLGQVRLNIRDSVDRRADNKSDIVNILQTASNYPGGLEELLGVVRFYEDANSQGWRQVEQTVARLLPNLQLSRAVPTRSS